MNDFIEVNNCKTCGSPYAPMLTNGECQGCINHRAEQRFEMVKAVASGWDFTSLGQRDYPAEAERVIAQADAILKAMEK